MVFGYDDKATDFPDDGLSEETGKKGCMHGRIKILVEAGMAWASERKERKGEEEAAKFEISYPRVVVLGVFSHLLSVGRSTAKFK